MARLTSHSALPPPRVPFVRSPACSSGACAAFQWPACSATRTGPSGRSQKETRHAAQSAADAEPELIRRAQAGDRAAFDALYAASAGRVYAVLLRLTADREQAERLTQDTFVAAWRRLATFRGDSLFTSWLHRIAVNALLQDGRTNGRREARIMTDEAYMLNAAGRSPSPDLRLDLERAIATLPPRARAVLVLSDVEGYSHEEVAAMTGVTTGTVKSQLHRARRLLRERLDR
jgi:RNA polymerase sigma factor (sigma-70 family)